MGYGDAMSLQLLQGGFQAVNFLMGVVVREANAHTPMFSMPQAIHDFNRVVIAIPDIYPLLSQVGRDGFWHVSVFREHDSRDTLVIAGGVGNSSHRYAGQTLKRFNEMTNKFALIFT